MMTEADRSAAVSREARFSIPALCSVVALVAVLGAGLAACSSGSGDAEKPAAPTSSVGTTDAGAGAGTPAAGSPEAANLLSGALGALGDAYHFVTTVRVGDEVVLTAEGDRVGSGARLDLAADGGTVSYVITDDGAWALPENGEWAELDVPPATADPIVALASPESVGLGPASDGVQVLNVVVSNELLGISGGGTSTLRVTLVEGRFDQVTYDTKVGDRQASATTIFSTVKDPAEVVAPI